ncbi:MAG: hypothetical protein JSS61_04540 [Verrucomicrobia bacterium]|nr:hypothetical protein [Verrucomicrobiota bacterium]
MSGNIGDKTGRVLHVITVGLLMILVRVWYLGVIQHDEHVERARRPQRRSVIEKVERATIRDRFNIPLALNKIQYTAAVCYADIRQIPGSRWEKNQEGKKVRVPVRATYIKELSELLAKELDMDAQKIEDTIHGKASLFPHTPFVIKEDLTEREYYRLKGLEKDWMGIRTEQGSKRYYPGGKCASDVLGYLGAISSREYHEIAQEIKVLQAYLAQREEGELPVLPKGFHNPLEVRERLKQLQEKAYTINDLVGKAGVEGAFDADLRGYSGKKVYEIDIKGNLIRELPGSRAPLAGQRLLLSISSELQEYAEQLLAHNEKVREGASLSTPWIKGGAIVAMDPHTGEVLTMASYPRINPNDFISSRIPEVQEAKQAGIVRWLESEAYVAEIWDGKRPLERERLGEKGEFYEETRELTLANYLGTILPEKGELLRAVQKIKTVGMALDLQEEMEKLLALSGQQRMQVVLSALYPDCRSKQTVTAEEKLQLLESKEALESARVALDPIWGGVRHNDDKLLILDLCRMLVYKEAFTPELQACVRTMDLSTYRKLCQILATSLGKLQNRAKEVFHKDHFQAWRETHFKEFLQAKRKEEKERKRYAKPYTEYLEQIEREQFKAYWENERLPLAYATLMESDTPLKEALLELKEEERLPFLKTMRSYQELTRPLLGKYRSLRNLSGVQLEKHLAAAFYPIAGYGYGRSQAFRQSTPLGSVFKLIPSYQALVEKFNALKQIHADLNPLTLIDSMQPQPKTGSNQQILGYTLSGEVIRRFYKGGVLPRAHPNIGKIDLLGALEQSSNMYFSILSAETIEDPSHIIQACRLFGFGEKTGVDLPGEFAGMLPNDITYNRTGLYSFAIGQHSLVVTPLQTAVMLSAIANKGHVLKPKIMHVLAGEEPLRECRDPFRETSYRFQDTLALLGIHFPLFTATQKEGGNPYVWANEPEFKRTLPMPDGIRKQLIEGMHRVIVGPKGTARPQIIRALYHNLEWRKNYSDLLSEFIGKTGTAEIFYKPSIDAESEAKIQNHIWFGGVAFAHEPVQTWEHPELVVVVYLRFSEAGGKEAAPLAAQIVTKWREICARHGKTGHIVLK